MNKTVMWIIGGVVGLGLIVLLALSIASEPEVDDSIDYGPVTVEGDPLPFLADPTQADPTVGFTAATVSGTDWDGNVTSIETDGRPKIVIFLAHWCSHCQAEVPEVQAWLDAGGLPDDVDMYSVTAFSDRLRPNWPARDWLDEEGWTSPVLRDDEIGTLVTTYGVRGTPFYVVLDGDNVNLGRFSGQVGIAGLETMAALAQASLGSS